MRGLLYAVCDCFFFSYIIIIIVVVVMISTSSSSSGSSSSAKIMRGLYISAAAVLIGGAATAAYTKITTDIRQLVAESEEKWRVLKDDIADREQHICTLINQYQASTNDERIKILRHIEDIKKGHWDEISKFLDDHKENLAKLEVELKHHADISTDSSNRMQANNREVAEAIAGLKTLTRELKDNVEAFQRASSVLEEEENAHAAGISSGIRFHDHYGGGGGVGSGDVHSASGNTAGKRSLLLQHQQLPPSSSSSNFFDPEDWSESKRSAPAAAGPLFSAPEHIHSALHSYHGGGGSGGHYKDEDEDDDEKQSTFAQKLADARKKMKKMDISDNAMP